MLTCAVLRKPTFIFVCFCTYFSTLLSNDKLHFRKNCFCLFVDSADKERDREWYFKTVVKRFPYQRAFTRHKNARFGRTGCSTTVNLRQTSEPKVRLQLLFPITSVTSLLNTRRSYSKMAILWRKPSSRQQIGFLKTNNKTQSVKDIKKYNSSTILLQGNVREWLCMWRSNWGRL